MKANICGDCAKRETQLCPLILEADNIEDCDNQVWPKPDDEGCSDFISKWRDE